MKPVEKMALLLVAAWPLMIHGQAVAGGQTGALPELVGAWTTVSVEDHMADGSVHVPSYGNHPRGILIYSADGHMAVEVMKPDRENQDLRTATAEQVRVAARGFLAYSGTYTVDRASGTVVHHVQVALNPADVGKDRVRHFKLEGDRLTITAESENDYGTPVQRRVLVWQRVR
jgi:hypothetical protein